MRKVSKKVIVFLLVFCLIFWKIQDVLGYKWMNYGNLTARMVQYDEFPEDSVDILLFGSSGVYAGIYPIILWEEYGVTSCNFGISMQTPMTLYYQVEYALKHQKPDVIVIDGNVAIGDKRADLMAFEPTYRWIQSEIPDREIKKSLLFDIVERNEEQEFVSYLFPLLRYHSRWSEITERDFVPISNKRYMNVSYSYGAMLSKDVASITSEDIKLSTILEEGISVEGKYYYDRLLRLCNENGIECVFISMPCPEAIYDEHEDNAIEQYCAENGVKYINYNTEEKFREIGIDLNYDFYNAGHLNVNGGIKLTNDLGRQIKECYNLDNHHGDTQYSDWDEQWKNL